MKNTSAIDSALESQSIAPANEIVSTAPTSDIFLGFLPKGCLNNGYYDITDTMFSCSAVRTFPVQLAPDGTPCVKPIVICFSDSGKKEFHFHITIRNNSRTYPLNPHAPLSRFNSLAQIDTDDDIVVVSGEPSGLLFQCFRVNAVQPDHLTATLFEAFIFNPNMQGGNQ